MASNRKRICIWMLPAFDGQTERAMTHDDSVKRTNAHTKKEYTVGYLEAKCNIPWCHFARSQTDQGAVVDAL